MTTLNQPCGSISSDTKVKLKRDPDSLSVSFSGQHPAGRAGSGERHGGGPEGVLRGERQPGAADVPQQQHRAAPLAHR